MRHIVLGNLCTVYHSGTHRFEGIVFALHHEAGLVVNTTTDHDFFKVGDEISFMKCDRDLLDPKEWL